jgi:uncharacterized membrane protein YphA (DoxX/SURF4 family)
MTTNATILLAFLALVFVVSGLSKASGNAKGLSGTRDVNVKDGIARVIGALEALLAFGLVLGLKWNGLAYPSLFTLWFVMAGAIFVHFKADKAKTAFPAFFLLTLISIALVLI